MAVEFDVQDSKKSKVKRLKFLPRIGIFVDFAGKEFTYKHVPMLETLMNIAEQDLSIQNLMKVSMDQLSEVKFTKKIKEKVVNTSARTISIERKKKKKK